MKKEYKLQNGRTAVFEYDANGIGKVTVEAMDYLIAMFPKWIPCSERVDIPNHNVLTCDKRGEMIIGCLAYHDEHWICESETELMYDPIAWMPLPEPYKGGK